jgi:hypothetical protein
MNANNPKLWQEVKNDIKKTIKGRLWGAYDSGRLVQEYKKRGGTFKKKEESNNDLKRWFREDWQDIAPQRDVIVFRPTKKINKDTPKTAGEISAQQIKAKVKEKRIKQQKGERLSVFV